MLVEAGGAVGAGAAETAAAATGSVDEAFPSEGVASSHPAAWDGSDCDGIVCVAAPVQSPPGGRAGSVGLRVVRCFVNSLM